MANFNPAVNPTNDPDYRRDSSAIDVPNSIQRQGRRENTIMPEGVKVGDRSGEYLGSAAGSELTSSALSNKGLGDIFAGIVSAADYGIKAADTLIRKQIEKDVYEQGKAEQDQFIQELQNKTGTAATQYASSVLDANAQATEDDLPEEVSGLSDTLEGMQAASPQSGGRFRPTGYDGRLLQLAKDMRAKYPGYKQFIDDQFTKVTGRDSANRLISQLTSQINENANSGKKEKNQTLTFLQGQIGSGNPAGRAAFEMYDRGLISKYKAYEMVAPWIDRGAKISRMEAERNSAEGQVTWDKNRAKEELDYKVSTSAAAFFENIKYGVGPGLPEENFEQIMTRFNNGEIGSTQLNRYGAFLKTKLVAMQKHLESEAMKGGRNSLSNVIGADETNKIITQRMAMAQNAVDMITKGEFKLADNIGRQLKAMTDDTQKELYTTPGIGPETITYEIQRRVLGDTGMGKVVENRLRSKDGKPTMDERMENWVRTHVDAITTQARRVNGGKEVGLNEIYTRINSKVTPQARQTVLSELKTLLVDPSIPDNAKANIAAAIHSNKNNEGFIGKIKIAGDTKDAQGNTISGRYTTFRALTDPKALAALEKIGGDTWKDAKDWIETTWGKDLFVQDIANLNKLQHDPRLIIGWDTDKKEFYVQTIQQDKPGEPGPNIPIPGPGYLKTYKDNVEITMNRLNSSLKAVSNIAKVEGKDVESYIFNTLQSAGWQTNAEVRGLPQEIYNAIISAKVREEKAKQEREQTSKDWQGKR